VDDSIPMQFPSRDAFLAKFIQILGTESSRSPSVPKYLALAAANGDDWVKAANDALQSRLDYERKSQKSENPEMTSEAAASSMVTGLMDRAWPIISSHRMQGVFGAIAAVLLGYFGLNSTGVISSTSKDEPAKVTLDSDAIVAAVREELKSEINPALVTSTIKAQVRESVNELLAGHDGSGLAKQIADRVVNGIEPDEIVRSTSRKAASAIEESGIVDSVSKRLAAEIRSSDVIEKSSARFVQDVANLHLADEVAVKIVGENSFKETQALIKKIAEKLMVQ